MGKKNKSKTTPHAVAASSKPTFSESPQTDKPETTDATGSKEDRSIAAEKICISNFTKPPIFFWKADEDPHGWYCQWYRSNFSDPESGLTFSCTEQWMMWNKAKLSGDEVSAKKILSTTSPRQQKQLGREVEHFDAAEWDRVKFEIVVKGNYLKFTKCTNISSIKVDDTKEPTPLRDLLVATIDHELVEASPYDRIWGIGFNAQDATNQPRSKWGENLLGKALMEVREKIIKEGDKK